MRRSSGLLFCITCFGDAAACLLRDYIAAATIARQSCKADIHSGGHGAIDQTLSGNVIVSDM
jgi:hypothetical protein